MPEPKLEDGLHPVSRLMEDRSRGKTQNYSEDPSYRRVDMSDDCGRDGKRPDRNASGAVAAGPRGGELGHPDQLGVRP